MYVWNLNGDTSVQATSVFIYTTIYTKVNGGALLTVTGGRENSNGRTKNSRNDVFFYLPLQQFCHTCTQAAQSRALVASRACT